MVGEPGVFRRCDIDPKSKQAQSGFTLIELISVIVILGVLAAVALPKFVNLKSNANEAVIRGMGAEILAAANLVFAKSAIKGVQGQASALVDITGDGVGDVAVVYGYPSGGRGNGIAQIMGGGFATGWTWSSGSSDTVFWLTTATLGGGAGQRVNNVPVMASNCYLNYFPATSTTQPRITYVTTSC